MKRERAANCFSDLITMDIDMLKLNGFDACRKPRKKNDPKYSSHKRDDQIPIVFITANDNMKGRKRGFDLGAADFITKPFKRGEILQTVHNILMPEKQGRRQPWKEPMPLQKGFARQLRNW